MEELKETDIMMNNDEVKALAIRIAYGGMPGDMKMLKSAVQVFNRDPIIDIMEKNEEVPDVVQFNSPILMSAIDFHPTPWIVKYIARKPAASPATGFIKKHLVQQKEIVEKVLEI